MLFFCKTKTHTRAFWDAAVNYVTFSVKVITVFHVYLTHQIFGIRANTVNWSSTLTVLRNSVSRFMNHFTSFLLWYERSGSSSCWSFLYCALTSTELMGSSASVAISHVQKLGHKSWPAIRGCKSKDISDTWHEVLGEVWIIVQKKSICYYIHSLVCGVYTKKL